MTPKEIYKVLSEASIDFDVVEVFEGARIIRIAVDDITDEQRSFMQAYAHNVAKASQDDLLYFFRHKDTADDLSDLHHWWACVEDVWLMWRGAIAFATRGKPC